MEKILKTPLSQQVWVSSGVFFGYMSQGSSVGYAATLIPQLRLEQGLHLTEESESWIASIMGFGLLIGTITAPIVMEKFGRKPANIISVVTMAVGWLMFLIADKVFLVILARFLKGIGMGQSAVVSGVTIAECTSPKKRGFFSSISISTGYALGVLLVHALGTELSWKHTAALFSIPPLLGILVFTLMPESPYWIASKGNYERTRKVFHGLRGENDKVNVELETMIKARISETAQSNPNKTIKIQIIEVFSLFLKSTLLTPLVVVGHLFLLSQFGASNIISTYALDIFRMVGQDSTINGSFWMVTIDSVRIIGVLFSVIIIRKFKRRTVLFFSGVTCCLSMLALSLCSYLKSLAIVDLSLFIMILLVAVSFFAITGIIPLPFSLAGELFPMEARSIGNCLAVVILNLAIFIMLKTAPGLFGSLGFHGFFFLYACGMGYCLLFLWFTLPETKDKTLENIEDDLKKKKNEALPIKESAISCEESNV